MLFVHADWLARRWLAKYYSLPSSRRRTKWLPVSNKVTLKRVKLLFGPLVIQLVWYILKQLFMSVKVVDINLHFGEQLLIINCYYAFHLIYCYPIWHNCSPVLNTVCCLDSDSLFFFWHDHFFLCHNIKQTVAKLFTCRLNPLCLHCTISTTAVRQMINWLYHLLVEYYIPPKTNCPTTLQFPYNLY